MKHFWFIFFFACTLIQLFHVIVAERSGNYDQATYEMLWLIVLATFTRIEAQK